MDNPLDKLENIENNTIPEMPQMTAEQELAMIKASYYQARTNFELTTEQTINKLYQSILESSVVIKGLQAENAKLKAMMKPEPSKISPPETTRHESGPARE